MKKLVGRRFVILAAACAVVVGIATAAVASPRRVPNWAGPQIASVVSHGLMAQNVQTFRPNDGLTRGALSDLDFGLTQVLTPPPTTTTDPSSTDPTSTDPTATDPTTTTAGTTTTDTTLAARTPVSDPNGTVTMAQLDRSLVATLGLSEAAAEFNRGARAAGIAVPSRFGTEVVARLLGLRLNHPAAQDFLELRPQDPATRAEAAYSAAQILSFGPFGSGWQTQLVQSLADSFAVPTLTDWQRRILTVAFSKIGMPYVWGGTSDGQEAPFGVPSRGGYDCSGFVWRVYKLQSYANEGDLASVIQGRTTMVMSVEVPRSKRIPFAKLQPADVLFFGAKGPRSTGPQIDHTAIYVGNGWFIQSSGEGVALAQLTGWYRHEFAWGRRPLQEAGLEG
jgi:cell wall-associated NlpC family hydrolase